MNSAKQTAIIFLSSFVFVGLSSASIPERYQTIVDRNSFGLNPPLPVETNSTPVVPPSDIKLTGFAQTVGERKAYFVVQSKDPKEPAQYVTMAEGEKQGVLELIKISENEGEVKIRNSGVDMVLSLKNNSFKLGQPPPNMAPQVPNRVVSSPGQASQPQAVAANPPAPSSVVASYNPNVVAGASPRSTFPGGTASFPNNQSVPMTDNSNLQAGVNAGNNSPSVIFNTGSSSIQPQQNPPQSPSQIGLVAGNNSPNTPAVVFNPNPPSRNSPSQTPQEQNVDPATQILLMKAQELEAKLRGRKLPPPPPVPGL